LGEETLEVNSITIIKGRKEGRNLPFYNYSNNVIAQSCFIGGCGNEDIILKELPSWSFTLDITPPHSCFSGSVISTPLLLSSS
jgi:hypothetical protein